MNAGDISSFMVGILVHKITFTRWFYGLAKLYSELPGKQHRRGMVE